MLETTERPSESTDTSHLRVPTQRLPYFARPEGRRALAWFFGIFGAFLLVFGFFYVKFGRMIDRRLAEGAFSDTVSIYTRPRTVAPGDDLSADEVVTGLKRSGYSSAQNNPIGWYTATANTLEVHPGPESYGGEPALLEFSHAKLARITSLSDRHDRKSLELEPELITNLSNQRDKRQMVRFAEIPQSLVNAVVSAEDKRFFHHSGFDFTRIVKAAYTDVKSGRKEQGASTLTMQLARGFWLDPEKRWTRKVEEFFLTMHLEDKLSKQQIFEDYANQIYLGRHGTFNISGFGEAARTYFGKDLSQVDTAEAALLAGLVQRPSYFNPARYPDRARERRNIVLYLMRQNRYLTDAQYRAATEEPIKVVPEKSENVTSQYFVDVMNQEIQNKLGDQPERTSHIYTTIDPYLQHAAQEAVDIGMKSVDTLLKKKRRSDIPADQPQVSLIALDPRTGEVKAMIGGRNYSDSQLNHALAMRQPGSVFKPFVYAAALDTALSGGGHVFTPATVLDDSPMTFTFNRTTYSPSNFGQEFMGNVTLRTALAHSLNVATVQLAQQVGYNKVVAMAQRAGLNKSIQATPSVALGAYETTPMEIAGAYTMFANHGMRVTPTTISVARSPDGTILYRHESDAQAVLDPRIAYLMVSMMEEVMRSGTAAGVRSLGFTLPAAGKTGTSRDGWFAGFTSELLCVVWVGFDDNRELNLEGAKSALPIWAEFMKRASKMRDYHDAKPFQAPPGISGAKICSDTGQLAGDYCPNARWESFVSGTQPTTECELHSLTGISQPVGGQ